VLSANPDGSDLKTLISEGRKFPDRLAVDVAAGHSQTLKRPGKLSSETTHLPSRIVADSKFETCGTVPLGDGGDRCVLIADLCEEPMQHPENSQAAVLHAPAEIDTVAGMVAF
jgi:hypothetical protein